MSATLRTLPTKLKPTARILIKREGTADYVDLGNVSKFAFAPALNRVEHMTAQVGDQGGGFARGDGNLISTISNKYTFTGDEFTNDSLRLVNLTTAAVAANQAANATLAVAIADVEPGKTYRIGKYGITAHALTFGGSSKIEGTDFILDYKSGLITILVGGAIISGDDVAGTVNVPAGTFKTATSTTEIRVTGQVIIELWDQFSAGLPRQVITIASAELYMTNHGEADYTKWMDFQGEIYALTQPVVVERQD